MKLPALTFAHAEALPAPVDGPAAIDRERLTLDEAALCRVGEEENGTGNVVGTGEAGHRNKADDVVVGVATPAWSATSISVLTQPGQTAFTRMPRPPHSPARARVRPIRPCFEAL